MVHNLKLAKIFWIITTAFAIFAALGGVLFRGIYVNLFPIDFLLGAFSQDVLTILVCALLFVLIAITQKKDVKKQVVIIGLLSTNTQVLMD